MRRVLTGSRAEAALYFAIAVALTVAVAITSSTSPASAQSPYPTRRGLIANGTTMSISEARLESEFLDRIGDPYGLDGLVLLVPDCNPDPEVYLDGALVHYGLSDAPGAINSDAVVWYICEEPRFVGFFWGADNTYANRFDDEAVSDAMVEDLRDENFTGAVAEGFDVVAESLGAPASRAAGGSGSAESRETGGGTNRARDALLVAVAGTGGWWWWRRRKKGASKNGKKKAESAAPDPTAAMAPRVAVEHRLKELRGSLTSSNQSLGRLVLLYEPMGDEAMLAINARHEAMIERLDVLEAGVTEIPVRAASADGEAGIDAEARADALYREALDEANALHEYVTGLPREADHAEMLIERAAVLAVEAGKTIERSRLAYDEAADEDLPPADEIMAFPQSLAERSEAALSAGDRLLAGELAEDADEAARAIARAASEFRAVAAAIDEAAITFERVDDFSEASWADIAGNGSESEESLDAARDMFRRVIEAESSAFGEDEAAGFTASLRLVFEELARSRNLAEAIGQRLARILEARDTSRGMLDSIGTEVDEARVWLEKPEVDRDVDPSPEDQLSKAEKQLSVARVSMAEATPDWIEIRRALHEADRLVDTALGNARDQQARMESLRRQVSTAREEALEALDKVEKYAEFHRRDVGVRSTDALRDAREAKRRAERNSNGTEGREDAALAAALQEAVERWATVRERADAAYSTAAQNVKEAENRRREYVPRPSWIGPTVPMPMPRRRWPMPIDINIGPGPIISPSGRSRAPRRSSWGSRPRGGPRIRPSGSSGRRSSGGSRPSSGRRGGGRGW